MPQQQWLERRTCVLAGDKHAAGPCDLFVPPSGDQAGMRLPLLDAWVRALSLRCAGSTVLCELSSLQGLGSRGLGPSMGGRGSSSCTGACTDGKGEAKTERNVNWTASWWIRSGAQVCKQVVAQRRCSGSVEFACCSWHTGSTAGAGEARACSRLVSWTSQATAPRLHSCLWLGCCCASVSSTCSSAMSVGFRAAVRCLWSCQIWKMRARGIVNCLTACKLVLQESSQSSQL